MLNTSSLLTQQLHPLGTPVFNELALFCYQKYKILQAPPNPLMQFIYTACLPRRLKATLEHHSASTVCSKLKRNT